MAPKKTRAGSSQPVSNSQPTPQQATRSSGRKRRHSDGSNASDVPPAGQGAIKTPAKRRKKSKQPAEQEPDTIMEEEEQREVTTTAPPAQVTSPDCGGQTEAGAAESGETIAVSQPERHVHFGSDDAFDKATATNITPHPSKMSIKRRVTTSPSAAGNAKRLKATTSRTSLPPSLSQQGSQDIVKLISEFKFLPLKQALGERIRRLTARKHELSDADAGAEITLEDVESADKEMLVLDSQEEREEFKQIERSPMPSTPLPSSQKALTRTSVDEDGYLEPSTPGNAVRASWEAERRKYQDAILFLKEESEKAKTNLHLLSIEVESLGFAEEGDSASKILHSLRESFISVRDSMDVELPGTVPEDASNETVLETLIANVREFADRLRLADREQEEKAMLVADLGAQVDGLMDHLAEKQVRIDHLHEQWESMDQSNETKERELEDREDELQAVYNERDNLQRQLNARQKELQNLGSVSRDLETNVDRLSASLEDYRKEESRLQNLITKMEEEHRATVGRMNEEREQTVLDLEGRLDNETQLRGNAEKQVGGHQGTITDLERQIEELDAQRTATLDELNNVKTERDDEKTERETAQATLQTRDGEVMDLEERVDRLEDQVREYDETLATLRELNDGAQRQRESAEAELDSRNAEINDLESRLQHAGKEANEVRLKLFEVQQNNIKELEKRDQLISEREQQYQGDMAAEVERREGADELAQERASTILDLETKLEEVETRMRTLLEEKDVQIAELRDQLTQQDGEIEALRGDLRIAESNLDAQGKAHTQRTEDLQNEIAQLKENIATHETMITELQVEAQDTDATHAADLEARDATLASLNHQLATLESAKADLETDRVGLERRVNAEAEAMLEFQNEKADEVEALKETIRDKQGKILIVEQKARETDARWQEVLDARDEEISGLRQSGEQTTQTVEKVVAQNQAIRAKLRDYVRRSSGVIGGLQERVAGLKAAVDGDGETMVGEGEGLLEEVEAMEVVGELRTTTTTVATKSAAASSSQSQAKGKKGGRKGKKRFADSGIGMDGDEEAEAV